MTFRRDAKNPENETPPARDLGKRITVNFDSQGGVATSPVDKIVALGSAFGILPATTRTGYDFAGWYTSVSEGSEVNSATIVTNPNTPQPLFALWEPNNFSVTFDPNGGVSLGAEGAKTVTFGAAYGALPVPSTIGATFIGWYTAATEGTLVTETSLVTEPSNHILYARWTPTTILVHLDSQGGTPTTPPNLSVRYDTAFGALPTTARAGYSFAGWYPQESNLGRITPTTVVTNLESPQTLYAHWIPNDYTVTFDVQGGDSLGIGGKKTVTVDAAYATLPVPSKVGFLFSGWNTAALAVEGSWVAADTTVTNSGDHTLYAIWNARNDIEVSLDPQGGAEVEPLSLTVRFDSPYGSLPATTKDGYDFEGWFTAKVDGHEITEQGIVGNPHNHTLYARWKPNSFTVNFEVEGGDPLDTAATKQVDMGSAFGTLPTPTLTGYSFDGWYTAPSDGTLVTAVDTLNQPDDLTLYAAWIPNTVTLNFDSQGGSTPKPSSKSVVFDTPYDDLPETSKTGFNFGGWFTQVPGGTEVIASTKVTYLDSPQTLYALWYPNSYTVTFDSRGGSSIEPSSASVTFGMNYGTLPVPSYAGYTFAGWHTAPDADGGFVTEASPVTLAADHTLYAHWSADTIAVSFDTQGGSPLSTPALLVVYATAYGTLPATTRSGYTFGGWHTQAGTEGSEVVATTLVADASAYHTLYAHWIPEDYTVTFDVQGGDSLGSNVTKKVTFGDSFDALPIPTYTGFSFAGWYTAVETDGSLVTDAARVTTSSDQTLYAHWTANEITVEFVDPAATRAESHSIVVPFNAPYGSLPQPTRTGYGFAGWYTAPDEGNNVLATTIVTNANSPHTLFAHWTADSYTVTFDVCGGNPLGIRGSKTVNYDAACGILPTPDYPGYGFDGWFTAEIGGDEVHAEDIVSTTEDKTFYAHWTARDFTVSFASQGGSTPLPPTFSVTFGGTYGSLPTATKEHFTFDGWYTAADGGTFLTETETVATPNDHAIYAHWVPDNYTVNFDVCGGNPLRANKSKTISFETAYGTLPKPNSRGYSFEGWYTQADETGDLVSETSIVTDTSDQQILYAHWVPGSYTVTFDPNGDVPSEAMETKSVTYQSAYGTLPVPERAGYDFDGWYTAAVDGESVTLADTVLSTADHTLYAHWSASRITVNFDTLQGKATNPASKTVTFKGEYGTLPVATCAGYTFDGWYTHADETGSLVSDSSTVLNAISPHTLYAHWTPKSYTVTFAVEHGDSLSTYDKGKVRFGSPYGTLPVPTRTGYTFAGWFTQISGWILVTATDPVVTASDHSLFAHWTPNTYTVTFDPNDDSFDGIREIRSVTFGATYDNLPTPAKTNYAFDGWYTAAEGGTLLTWTDAVTTPNDHTLYAHWSAGKVTVSFDSQQGAATSPAEKVVTFEKTYGALPKATRPGFSFVGWYTKADDEGILVTATTTVTDTSKPQTLFAHWTPQSYSVSFDTQGGALDGLPDLTVDFDKPYGPLPTAAKTNYTFDGWYTAAEGGTLVSAIDPVTIADDHTLYAHWLGNTCIVTFEIQWEGSLGAAGTKTVNYDAAYGTLPVPTYTGYSFDGWFTASSGGSEVSATDKVTTTCNHTLYAHRTANTLQKETGGHSGADPFLGITDVLRGQVTSLVFSDTLPTEGSLYDVSVLGNGTIKAQVSGNKTDGFRIVVGASGGVHANADSSNLFAGLSKISTFDLTYLDTSTATTMSFLFAETIFPADFVFPAKFGSGAVNMQGMFNGATLPADLVSFPEGFGTQAIYMDSMFASAIFPRGLTFSEGFGIEATDMNFMFYNTTLPSGLTAFPKGFGAQAVDISAMFYNATLNADIDWTLTTFAKLSSLDALGTFGGTLWNGHTIKVVDAETQAKFIAAMRL